MQEGLSSLIHSPTETISKNGSFHSMNHRTSRQNSALHSQSFRKSLKLPGYPVIFSIPSPNQLRENSVMKKRYLPSMSSLKLKETVKKVRRLNRTLLIRLGSFRISKVCQSTQKKEGSKIEWPVQNMLRNLIRQRNLKIRLKI